MSAFESLESPVSVQDLAAHAQIPLSTAHRMVGELVEWGALERDKNGGIHLGGRLTRLVNTRYSSLRQLLLPYLEDLCALTGHTVSLGLREGDKVRVSERCYGQTEAPRLTRVGSRVDLHLTAMGKTLLAHSPQWLLDAYLSRELSDPLFGEPGDLPRLKCELEQILKDGFVQVRHHIPEAVQVLAVPVYHQQNIVCALDIMRPSDPKTPMIALLPALQATMHQVQAELEHFQTLPPWDND